MIADDPSESRIAVPRLYLALYSRYELIEPRFARMVRVMDALAGWTGLTRRAAGAPPPDPARILVQSAMKMGDAVMAGGGVAALRERFPRAEIDGLASPASAPVWGMIPGIGRVFVLDNPIYHLRNGAIRGFGEARAVFDAVRARRYDWAVDFVGDLAGNWALSRTGARATVAHDSMGGGPWLTHVVPRDWSHRHQVEVMIETLRFLGVEGGPPPMTLVPPPSAEAQAAGLRARHALPERGYLVCVPGAGAPSKAWPAERFAAALDGFAVGRGVPVVLTGSPDDADIVGRVASGTRARTVDLTGLPLDVLTALLPGALAFLGNDSGPAHLAAARGAARVVLFGPMPAERYGHPGERSASLGGTTCPGAPCSYATCKRPDRWCMLEIQVADVVHALERVTS